MREKIKLESSAGTGHFIPLQKTNVLCQRKWKSKNLIQWYVNMSCTKKPSSNKFSFYKKSQLEAGFFYFLFYYYKYATLLPALQK